MYRDIGTTYRDGVPEKWAFWRFPKAEMGSAEFLSHFRRNRD